MSFVAPRRNAGFTLSELFVGLMLSSIVMAAVLSTYIYVARSYARTIGFGLPNEPTLESQGRRTLAYFMQDVSMASTLSSPTSFGVTLTIPDTFAGTKNVTYYFNSADTPSAEPGGVQVPANSLVRIDRSTNRLLKLHSSLLTCTFAFFDSSGLPYLTYSDYAMGIKQVSLQLTTQGRNAGNQAITQEYRLASPRLILRNKSLPP